MIKASPVIFLVVFYGFIVEWSTLILEYSSGVLEYSAEGQLSISRQALVRDQFEISDVILARDILPVTL